MIFYFPGYNFDNFPLRPYMLFQFLALSLWLVVNLLKLKFGIHLIKIFQKLHHIMIDNIQLIYYLHLFHHMDNILIILNKI